jgi:hypothetical protein
MGTRYSFQCVSCRYRATVSGDYDMHDTKASVTIACPECRRLYDLELEPMPHFRTRGVDASLLVCPRSKGHRPKAWTHPGSCPRCGATMRLAEMLSLWDP